MATFRFLQRSREGFVEHLVLNRPEVRNAFNEDLIAEMTAWADEVSKDTALRAVVLSGAGPLFCSGGDLAWMAAMAAASPEDNYADAAATAAMFTALDRLPVPLIARVHGAALGGGAGLAAVADVVIADAETIFGFTEVKLGLLPAIIAPYVLAKIGQSNARQLFLTGRRFSASYAREIGLVHMVVTSEFLDEKVQESVEEILTGGRDAIAASKALIRRLARASGKEATQLTIEAIAATRASAEAQERIKNFLARARKQTPG
jgi:methylglutaconyl-CoA hydratase